jgi:hypothetical protein
VYDQKLRVLELLEILMLIMYNVLKHFLGHGDVMRMWCEVVLVISLTILFSCFTTRSV